MQVLSRILEISPFSDFSAFKSAHSDFPPVPIFPPIKIGMDGKIVIGGKIGMGGILTREMEKGRISRILDNVC